MKKAIIDLGTNTFNLLIGTIDETEVKIEFATKVPVLLGMGGINEGIIAPDALDRAKTTLREYKNHCDDAGVTSILGLGTSAMRAARNANEIIDFAKKELGIDIFVISGEEEAALIYDGVNLIHTFTEEGMIMDIGGGSTEYILANHDGVVTSASFDIGVSRVFQKLGNPEVFTDATYGEIDSFFNDVAGDFFKNHEVDLLIGASGSFETMYEMIFEQKFPAANATVEIPLDKLRSAIDWSLKSTLQERIDHPWIVPMRKNMLPVAAYCILWTIEKLETKKVVISPYSLKEGAFLR